MHLSDPDLSPVSIARAHGITVRKLFQLLADAGTSLEQWIITSRLEGAHDDLAPRPLINRSRQSPGAGASRIRRTSVDDPARCT
ncbi:hypothetical protein A9310_22365 [Gordonia sp. UCD-TK1]|jgi:hypothetical protein|nr:hypothetical protein A9310_22365 [Gordonia sp. UCD-TK1]OCW87215.1 hypothetical protein A8M60_17785 [Nocardia farcinica]